MFHVAAIGGAGAWGRRLAVLSLAGIAFSTLPQAPAAARGFAGSRFSGRGFRSGFGGSHFGISFGNRNFRFNFGTGRFRSFHSFRPYYSSVYIGYPFIYPSYYGGLYSYGDPYIYSPPYAYSEPRTIYVYPPPIVRTYPDSEPAPKERARHPYEEPVSLHPERGSVDEALADIRKAWLTSDVGPLTAHLSRKDDIAIYRDGDLRQELAAEDFLSLNKDAFREIHTISFRFTEVHHPAADEATATAVHTYVPKDGDGTDQTATLHYDLVRRDDVWTLRAVHVLPSD